MNAKKRVLNAIISRVIALYDGYDEDTYKLICDKLDKEGIGDDNNIADKFITCERDEMYRDTFTLELPDKNFLYRFDK